MASAVAPGTLIAKKYRVERVIGEGGMGVVVVARHVELDRRVAVKLVKKEAVATGSIERLLREARAAASIESPHVARVLDVGRTKSGEPYLVLEYLEGEDLHARIARLGPARPSDAVAWVLEACEGLAAAHARGIVHRDLKPSNLFLARQPAGGDVVKVLDFGLAKKIDDDDGRITATGAILGSPSYMSPEHLSGRPLDARSDVWSLGVTLYELLTNALPFPGRTTPEICAAVLSSSPVAIVRQDVPDALAAIVMRCLDKDAALRPRDVGELASLLEPFVTLPGAAARVVATLVRGATDGPLADAIARDAPTHLVSAIDAPARERGRAVLVAIALGAIGLLTAVSAVVVTSRRPTRPDAPVMGSASPGATSAEPPASASVTPDTLGALAIPTLTIVTSASVTRSRVAPNHPRLVPSRIPSARGSNPLERF